MAADPSVRPRRRLRDRFGTIRFRTTGVAVTAVAAALLAGGAVLVLVMRSTLTDQVRAMARSHVATIVSALEAGAPPTLTAEEEEIVQVLDDRNQLIAASPAIAGEPAVALLSPGQSKVLRPPDSDEDFVAVAAGTRTSAGPVTVIVARSIGDVVDATSAVTRLLLIGIPVLLAIVGLTV
jgi:hypothetical protein